MSEDAWRESATNDVLYPDDLPGHGPITIVGEPLEAETVDVDGADHGLLAELADDHGADYVICPKNLRLAIAAAWGEYDGVDGAVLEVLEADRGPEDHAEWHFDVRTLENGDAL